MSQSSLIGIDPTTGYSLKPAATPASLHASRCAVGDGSAFSRGSQGRIIYLDALRGVAILLVLAYHVCTRFDESVRGLFFDVFSRTGWAGVDIFYAISGFLITRILISDQDSGRLAAFFIKRFFRIVPLFFVAVVAYIAVSLSVEFERDLLSRIWIPFLFLTAWLIPFFGEDGVPYTISWSVSVEESAYLIFGLFSVLGFVRFRRILWAILALALVVRIAAVGGSWFDARLLYYFVPARIDTIALGGLFALATPIQQKNGTECMLAAIATALVIGTFGVFGKQNPVLATIGYTVLGLISAGLVSLLARAPRGGEGYLARGLARIGEVSYFIYLFHMFVIGGLFYLLPEPWPSRLGFIPIFAIVLGMTYLAARISWVYFEFPLIGLGRRIAHGRRRVMSSHNDKELTKPVPD